LIQTSQDRSHNNKNKQTSMLKFHQKTISLVLALLLKPKGIFAHVGGRTCGTKSLTEEQKEKSKEVTAKWKASGERLVAEDVVVPTYFHIINPSGNEINGNEQAQVDDLNEGFAGTGFSFELKDSMTYDNDDWWGIDITTELGNSTQNVPMKSSTRVGDCEVLNVWWTDIAGGILGYARFPEWCDKWGDTLDGVVNLHTTGVGGSFAPYNEGATLIHEVGHEGGCGTDGDLVDDTPEVAEENFGSNCDAELDSCPNDGQGPDMLENYMDYLDDVCLTTFTPGQMERMVIEWNEHRRKPSEQPSSMPSSKPTVSDGDDCCEEKSATTKILKEVFGFES